MRTFIKILVSALVCFLAQMILPWWIIVPVLFLIDFFYDSKPGYAFFTAFNAVFALWFIIALWIDISNGQLLSARIAILFHLPPLPFLMAVVSALVGGLVGGMSALSAVYARRIFRQ